MSEIDSKSVAESGLRSQNIWVRLLGWAGIGLMALVLALVIFYPALRVFVQSVFREGAFTLAGYKEVFDPEHPAQLRALGNSLIISLGSVALAAVIGTGIALFYGSYRFPGRSAYAALAILPIVLPPIVGVVAFEFLLGSTGIIPRLFQNIFGLSETPFGLDGIPAVIVVHGYSFSVYFYFLVQAALGGMDPTVKEAALNLGASKPYTFVNVTLPLLMPALLGASLLVFMQSMASFSAPLIFASEKNILTLAIFNARQGNDLQAALTLTSVLTAISIAFLFLIRAYSRRVHVTVASRLASSEPPPELSQRGKIIASAAALLITLVMLSPHLTVLLISFASKLPPWTMEIIPPQYSFENYARIFTNPRAFNPILTSLKLSLVSTAACLAFGVGAAYAMSRARSSYRGTIDLIVMIPWALPGIAVAINLIAAFGHPNWLNLYHPLVGTFWILPMAYFTRHMPIVFRSSTAALAQVDESVVEAGQNLGAGSWYLFRRVIAPMVAPGVLGGCLLVFVNCLAEFAASRLLYLPTHVPISIAVFNEFRQSFGTACAYGTLLIILIGFTLVISNRFLGVRTQGIGI